ncbi:hypothetical protein [Glycomyces sp. YM15]|uniref:hypothetical protein n=1 Tax=Glycomyces sp. YM15 TaxID=2800446 RepID=UPI001965B638|nr:hypothetical protein [Glycomyces sp. YM15]
MGVGRLAPHRVRAKYARALAEIPLPVRSREGTDPRTLVMIASATVADRELLFGLLPHHPRLWVVFAECDPPILGHLTGLSDATFNGGPGPGSVTAPGEPELHITAREHLDWTRLGGRAAQIKREAVAAWQAAQRECEG